MYCPKCSQQQVSDEMRFCARCGFPLSAVKELVAAGGALAEPEAEQPQGSKLSPAFRGVRKGVWVMLASFVLALVAGFLTAIDDVFAVFLLPPVLCFIIGFALVLYGVFLADRRASLGKGAASQPRVAPLMPGQPDTAARTPELSPPRVAPIEGFTPQRMKTAEMVQPPSVTENTTRLLDDEADSRRV